MSEVPGELPRREVSLTRIPFTPRQEASMRALCNWMQIAAIISFISAVGKLVSAFTPQRDYGQLIGAVITFLIALWIFQAGTAFRKVANTDTADQRYLMDGFVLLRRVFLLQAILVIIVLAFLVIALVVVGVVAATHVAGPR
jgi:hypothetical protein